MTTPPTQKALFDSKPVRVTVPVPPDVLEAFQRLAAVSGVSTGRAMGEWLTDTLDGVLAMCDLMEKAKRAPHLAVRELSAYAAGMSDLTTELLEEVRKSSRSKVQEARGGGGGAIATTPAPRVSEFMAEARRRGSPPLGNTGGKVPKGSTKVHGNRGKKP